MYEIAAANDCSSQTLADATADSTDRLKQSFTIVRNENTQTPKPQKASPSCVSHPSAHHQPNYDMDNDSAQNSALPQWAKVLEITHFQ